MTTNLTGLTPACSGECPDITIDFASPVLRFGLVIAHSDIETLTLTVFRGGSDLGSVPYTTGIVATFAGIEELSGFDRVVIDVAGSLSGAFAADLFRFDVAAAATGVPMPATLVLLASAVVSFGAVRTWRRP